MEAKNISEEKLLNFYRSLANNQREELIHFLMFLKFQNRKSKLQNKSKSILSFEGIIKDRTTLNSVELQKKSKEFWSDKYVSH